MIRKAIWLPIFMTLWRWMHFGRNMQRITNTSVIEDKIGFDQIYIQAKKWDSNGVPVDPKYKNFWAP